MQHDENKMKEEEPERPLCRCSEAIGIIGVLTGVRSGCSLIFLGLVLCCFQSSEASDAGGIQNEKNPESRYYTSPLLKVEEARKKQGDYDARAAIGDPAAAEKELEGLNNTVSNAMRLASDTRRAEEASGGLFKSVVTAAALLGAGIFLFRKVGPTIGSYVQTRFGIWLPESDAARDAASNAHEDKNFSDFVAAFKVGPTPGARRAAVD